jgi:hypothetical protein
LRWRRVSVRDLERKEEVACLDKVALRTPSARADGVWVRAELEDANVSTTTPPGPDTNVAVQAGPGRETLAFFARLASLPDIAAHAASAKDGACESQGRVQNRGSSELGGAFLFSVGPFRAGLALDAGHSSIIPFADSEWLRTKLREH